MKSLTSSFAGLGFNSFRLVEFNEKTPTIALNQSVVKVAASISRIDHECKVSF